MPAQRNELKRLNGSKFLSELPKLSERLKDTPEFMVDILYRCTTLKSDEIKNVINKLIALQAFNPLTIVQSNTRQGFMTQQSYSVIYLLLSNAENREVLKENPALCDLIGKELSEDLIKQFKDTTHEGILYYLLTDELGQEILKKNIDLQRKINHIDKTDNILSKEIVAGPFKGKTFRDCYAEIPGVLRVSFAQLSLTNH